MGYFGYLAKQFSRAVDSKVVTKKITIEMTVVFQDGENPMEPASVDRDSLDYAVSSMCEDFPNYFNRGGSKVALASNGNTTVVYDYKVSYKSGADIMDGNYEEELEGV